MTEVMEALSPSISTEGGLDSIDGGDTSCCKITSLPNPVAFDSGLIGLPDYAAKRLIQRKRRGANDQQQNRVSGMSGVTSVASSVTNLESIASSHEQDQENKMVQFVDEFSSPFSFFPQNGFSFFSFTCEKDKSPAPSNTLTNKQSEGSGNNGEVKESKNEGDEERVVKLSDMKKRVIEEARNRKEDPVAWEDVKKRVSRPALRAQSRLNIHLVSPSSAHSHTSLNHSNSTSSSPALSRHPNSLSVAPQQMTTAGGNGGKTSPMLRARLSTASTIVSKTASIEASSSISTNSSASFKSQKPLLSGKQLKDKTSMLNESNERSPIRLNNKGSAKCDSALTLTSDIETDHDSTGATSFHPIVKLAESANIEKPEIPMVQSNDVTIAEETGTCTSSNSVPDEQVSKVSSGNDETIAPQLTISEELGEKKLGGATSYEFLLDW